jgi:hypothetical protein
MSTSLIQKELEAARDWFKMQANELPARQLDRQRRAGGGAERFQEFQMMCQRRIADGLNNSCHVERTNSASRLFRDLKSDYAAATPGRFRRSAAGCMARGIRITRRRMRLHPHARILARHGSQ